MYYKIKEFIDKLSVYESKVYCIVREIEIPTSGKIYIFDESSNPSGTHKDRIACYQIRKYLKTLLFDNEKVVFPDISIISSGSGALAFKKIIDFLGLNIELKVLIDYRINNEIKQSLDDIGCIIYEYDLSSKLLNSSDIRKLTDNSDGIELTNRDASDIKSTDYYNDLFKNIVKYEIESCFLPFGSGDLFSNLISLSELNHNNISKTINFFAATVNDPDEEFIKLFAYFLPTRNSINEEIIRLKNKKIIGDSSNIFTLNKKFFNQALNIATNNNLDFEYSALAGLVLYLEISSQTSLKGNVGIILTGNSKLNNKKLKSIWLKNQNSLVLD